LRAIEVLYEYGLQIIYDNKPVPLDMLPTVTRGEVDYATGFSAELRENIDREDLTWQERETALAEWHLMRSEEATERGEKQTLSATAQEIKGDVPINSMDITAVSRAVLIQKHIQNPEVAKAKSAPEAVKVIERVLQREHNARVADIIKAKPPDSKHKLLQQEDPLTVSQLEGLPSESFDLILTDPPYGIDADNFGSMQEIVHGYKDNAEFVFNVLMPLVAKETFRIAKPQAHLYLFCDPRWWALIEHIFGEAHWRVWPTPLIWYKKNGMLPRPEHGPRRVYETILFASKGDRKVTGVYSDLIETSQVQNAKHAAQKPVALYHDLIKRSCRPGDSVIDPFCGSGTIFAAANRSAVFATGIESDHATFGLASTRLNTTGD
jgi:16S rRNA G966 N2-methylase RsmD